MEANGGMKNPKDRFSKQALTYKKFRPQYPEALYKEILQFVTASDCALDSGTGSGQVALVLSGYFKTVHATDISESQLSNAARKDNIFYRAERAENTSFAENQFNLITVAQAIHWFDIARFNREIKRIARNNCVLAIWGYGLLKIDKTIDHLISSYYNDVIGPYWDQERKYVDDAYSSVKLNFDLIVERKDLNISLNWDLNQLEGYLNSWSSVQNYRDKNAGITPVGPLIKSLASHWPEKGLKTIRFPIFLKVFRVEK